MTRDVGPAEAEQLVASGAVHVLDVRTPAEHRQLGHVPGAILLPVDLVVSGAATLPRDRPLLVHCEHGVRSVYACEVLERAGFDDLVHLAGGLAAWTGPRAFDAAPIAGLSSWLLETADLLPRERGRALDAASGRGRHALLLAAAGFAVDALDRDEAALAFLRGTAERLDLPVSTRAVDLEAAPGIERDAYALVAVFHYLHRPLFPALVASLAPGGLLLYETFTVDQAALGKPRDPAHLLEHGELARLVAPLEVLRERDGLHEGRHVAAVAARRPAGPA